MKILYIYQYFCTPKGSWGTRVYELSKRWQAEGHQVTVITAPYEKTDIKANGLISFQNIEGMELIVINSADSNRSSIPVRAIHAIMFATLSSLVALFRKTDIVIASSGPISVAIPMLLLRLIKKVQIIFEVRDLWPSGAVVMDKLKGKNIQKIAYSFEKMCYKRADLVVPASIGMEADILNRYPGTATLVIPNAADNDLFGKMSEDNWSLPKWTTGMKMFLSIGSIGFIHNPGFLIDVAKELMDLGESTIHIVLIGEGAERQVLEQRVAVDALTNVTFLGLLPKTEVANWLNHAVATLFTTLNNHVQNASSPNKIFDSLAAGVPIIQTTTGWIKNLFEAEKCGINIAPNDARSFAEAMVLLSKDEILCRTLGENAKNLALTAFDRDRLSTKYLNALLALKKNEK
jgi:glycosyltransferase involved in cell wall biosynthesis